MANKGNCAKAVVGHGGTTLHFSMGCHGGHLIPTSPGVLAVPNGWYITHVRPLVGVYYPRP